MIDAVADSAQIRPVRCLLGRILNYSVCPLSFFDVAVKMIDVVADSA